VDRIGLGSCPITGGVDPIGSVAGKTYALTTNDSPYYGIRTEEATLAYCQ